MNTKIRSNPDFGHLDVALGPGETVRTEAGAMAQMSSGLEVKTKLVGGLFGALVRRVFAGESLFMSDYSSPTGGNMTISPSIPGHVAHRDLSEGPIFLQGGAFLASTPRVSVRTRFGGLRAILGGEGLFFLYCSGKGHLWFNAYGSIIEKQVNGELIVDTGHVVGWEPTLDWRVTGMGNLFSTLFSGEGLVLRFTGNGKVWLQTRSVGAMVGWLRTYC